MEALLVVICIAGVIGFFVYRRRQKIRAWQRFAMETGLQFTTYGLFNRADMEGTYGGRRVHVYTEQRGDHDDTRTYTVFSLGLPGSVPASLILHEENWAASIGKFFGGEDIEVGRSQLDETFVIKGDDPDRIRSYLDRDDVANALLDLHADSADMHIEHGMLSIDRWGFVADREELASRLDALVHCSNRLGKAGSPDAYATTIAPEADPIDSQTPGGPAGEDDPAESDGAVPAARREEDVRRSKGEPKEDEESDYVEEW